MRHLCVLTSLALAAPLFAQTPKIDNYFGNVLPSLDGEKIYTSMPLSTADQTKWGAVFPTQRVGVRAFYFSSVYRVAASKAPGFFGLPRDLFYTVYPDVQNNTPVLAYRRSANGGISWEAAQALFTPATGESVQDVRLLTAGVDYVFALLLVVNNTSSRLEVLGSKDRGKTFISLNVSTKISTVLPIQFDACASSDGALHIAYTATAPTPVTFNTYYSKIEFSGNSLTRSVDTLYQGLSGELDRALSFWSRVACDGQHICFSWISQRSATDFETYLRHSSDGGKTWGKAVATGIKEDVVEAGPRLFCTFDNSSSSAKPLAWLVRLDTRSGRGQLLMTKVDMAAGKVEKTENITQGTAVTNIISWDALVTEYQGTANSAEEPIAIVAWSEPDSNTKVSADSADDMLAKKHSFTSVSAAVGDPFFALTNTSLDARLVLEDRRSLVFSLFSSGGLRKVVGHYRSTGDLLVTYGETDPGQQIGKNALFVNTTCAVSRNGDMVAMWLENFGGKIAGCATQRLVVKDETSTSAGELVFRGAPPGTTMIVLPNIQKLIPPTPIRIPGISNVRMQWDSFTGVMLSNFLSSIIVTADSNGLVRAKSVDLNKQFPRVTIAFEALGARNGRFWRQNLMGPLPRR